MTDDRGACEEEPVSALVLRVIHDLDRSTPEHRCLLLSDLLCVAWPTQCGQDQ
jgi:hypothetical protein